MKRETNAEFFARMMNFSGHGALMQAFIIQGLLQWAEKVVAEQDQIPENSFVAKEAWVGCAYALRNEINDRLGIKHASAN